MVDDLGREHRDLAVVAVSNNPYAELPHFGPSEALACGTSGDLLLPDYIYR